MTGGNIIVLYVFIIFHSLYSLTEFYEHDKIYIYIYIFDISNFLLLLHCMFKCSCIRM